jgi:phosphate transport system permease protein
MRSAKAILVPFVAASCAVVSLVILLGMIGAIAWRGFPAMRWSFFTEQIRLVGAEGGISYNLIGTGILIVTAFCVAAPFATALAFLHGVYLAGTRWQKRLELMLYVMNGIPSILFGIFGLILFVKYLGWGKSWLAGGILLGLMILPTTSVAFLEKIAALPKEYIDAAAGLGLSQSQIIWSVIFPQSASGLVTGSFLGLARAAGETAPIMFTATIFAGATIPNGIKESPVLSLPYHIFIIAQDSFDPNVATKLWGTALVLVGTVFALSLAALPARIRMHEEARHD